MSDLIREDLHFDEGELDHDWAHGPLELDEGERPASSLGSEPGPRKWMLLGVGGAGLLTAALVLAFTGPPDEASQGEARDNQEPERPLAPRMPAPASEDDPVESGAPAAEAETLVATAPEALRRIHRAPPPPLHVPLVEAAAPATPASPASSPSPEAATDPPPDGPLSAPASTPTPPETAPAPAPLADPDAALEPEGLDALPDVEGWDEVDEDSSSEEVEALPEAEAEMAPESSPEAEPSFEVELESESESESES